ncbi:MAG: methylmalonyl-CoA mutase [Deltaproteobacteria bacterium]|nr:methylmalonyl-CoA mutase [Deltaproteobacteria bacterium]
MDKELEEIVKSQEDWENTTLKKWLDKFGERDTYSLYPCQRLYTPVDRKDSSYLKDIGFPGEYPFTRGLNPTEFRSRLWYMTQGMGFGTPEETNRLYKLMFSKGSNRFTTKIDLPCQVGYDPDNPMSEGEVGVIGTSIPSLKEMQTTLDGIPLEKAAVSGLIGNTSFISWSMVMAVAKKQGVSFDKLSLNVMADCLNEYISRGNYIFPPENSLRLSVDLAEYVFKAAPKTSFVIGCGYPIAEAGATMNNAVALMLACGLLNIDKLLERGIEIDEIAPRVGFNIHVGLDFFPEIAKFRALRRLWARIMKEKYGAKRSSSLHFRFGPGTAGSAMTSFQPENNIIRATVASMAAVLGGAHSLNVSSFDEAIAIPTERSAHIALATQQILAYETGIPDVVDPMGGSYYIETLTDRIEKEILDYLDKIENQGGLIKAIKSGWVRSEIAGSAYARQKEIESGQRTVVGVNKFTSDEEPSYEIHRADPGVEKEMIRRVRLLREERDNGAVQSRLEKLKKAAEGEENIIPYIIEAVESYTTVEDICNALVTVFGRWEPTFMARF